MDPLHSVFVLMPFRPELHYFYLYLKGHIEQKHHVICQRGDADVLTVPVLDKIKDYIRTAEVLIADCTGRNPNVYYELGMAHAQGKKVILITQDPIEEAPTDVRHHEFIRYSLGSHSEFFERLDNALHNVFRSRFDAFYEAGKSALAQFRRATSAHVELAPIDVFVRRMMAIDNTTPMPALDDELSVAEHVLPRIILENTDYSTMSKLTEWITAKLSAQASSTAQQAVPADGSAPRN